MTNKEIMAAYNQAYRSIGPQDLQPRRQAPQTQQQKPAQPVKPQGK